MAKLTVTVDTETQEQVVTVDGQAVPNANSVSTYSYGTPGEKYYEVHFEVSASERVGEVSKITRLYASETEEAKRARSEAPSLSKAQAEMIQLYKRYSGR